MFKPAFRHKPFGKYEMHSRSSCISQFQLRPAPQGTAVHLPALSVLGVGAFANFALPRGRAFANPGAKSELWTRTQFPIRIIIITTQKVLLEKRQIGSPVKDRNKLKRVVQACSRFYEYVSSLLYQPRITWRKTGAIDVNQCVLVIESNFC